MHSRPPVSQEATTSNDRSTTPSRLEHYACALAGLGAVAVLLLLFTPLLLDLTERFGAFATTVLVFGLTALWALVWLSLESVWEWRAGRLGP